MNYERPQVESVRIVGQLQAAVSCPPGTAWYGDPYFKCLPPHEA